MKLLGTLPLVLALGWLLVPAAESSSVTCVYQGGNLGSWHEPLHWDCGHVPGAGDTAVVPQFKGVAVTEDASVGGVFIGGPGTSITFSGGATLATGTLDAASATLQGDGTVTVAGTFHKGGIPDSGTLTIFDTVDLVLNGDSVMDAGTIAVCQAGDPPSDPTLHINADFTIAEGASTFSVFNCSSSGARIRVGPAGHLIKAASGQTTSDTAIDNDGTLTVQAGTLLLTGGTANALGATSDGDYVADEGATLAFQGGSPPAIGATGSLGGAGKIHVNTIDMDMLAGSVLDPAVLQLSGVLRLRGTDPVTLPDLELTNGVIDSDRPVAVDDMDVTAGRLQRDFTLTVRPGGSFTKTSPGTLFVGNNGAFGSADLVLDADASLDEGTFCVARTGTDPDVPGLSINQDFTIGSGAPSGAFQCGPQFGTFIHVNGPDGHLSKVGPGTTNFNDLDLAGGTLSVASGQTFVFANTYAQSAGVTEIASGGTLQASPTLTGGVLRGGGQVSGNVTNAGGTVRPAGTLSVAGAYTQGAGGTLEADVATAQHDRLAVTGAASLDGTLAAVPAAGFDPAAGAAFGVLTSGSRTGAFSTLTGARLPAGKRLALEYPGSPDFGARLVVTPPQDLVLADCDDPALATVTEVTGDLVVDTVPGCDAVELPALEEVTGNLIIIDNDGAEVIGLGDLDSVGGNLTITGNDFAEAISLGDVDSVGGDLTIEDNGDATVALGSPDQVGGDLTLDTTGDGPIALGDGSPAGDLDLDTTGYAEVSGATAGGTTTIANAQPEAQMRVVLPEDAFSAPVPFTITRLDPAALPPVGTVDPVVAYTFEFGVPTLNSPAELSFAVRLSGLDQGTRDALLAALADGRATLATRGDGAYQTFPLCTAGAAPTAEGCVLAEHAGDVVRFTGVVGHFSTWAVAIVAKPAAATPTPTSTPAPTATPAPLSKPAFGPRTLVTLTPAARRVRARGPLRIRVANANAFAVTGRVAGRKPKLRARTLSVPARGSRTIALKLPKAVQRQLKRRGRVSFRLAATVTDPAGNRRTVTRRVTVRRR